MSLQKHSIEGDGVSSGVAISKTGAMQLTASSGDFADSVSGIAFSFPGEVINLTSDATHVKSVRGCLVYDAEGSPISQVWIDEITLDAGLLKDCTNTHECDPPAGYEVAQQLFWCFIAAGETDLDNGTVHWMEVI